MTLSLRRVLFICLPTLQRVKSDRALWEEAYISGPGYLEDITSYIGGWFPLAIRVR